MHELLGDMPAPDSDEIAIPVFAGQGTTRTSLRHAASQAVRDADEPAGSFLLSSCLDVFVAELAALSPEDLDQSGICPSDFDVPRRLLIPDPKYAKNHIISATFLFIAQVLRYQSYIQATSRSFLGFLSSNVNHATGVLGLSSGIFPACVVAASRSPLSYITTAVEILRLVFWVSLRVLQFTRRLMKEKHVDATLPWSIGCLGLTKADVEQQIVQFERKYCQTPSLHVAAVLDEKNVTISGRPDLLAEFSTFVSQYCTVHPTTVDALYHSDLHFPDTRDLILADVGRRNIRFPDYQDLCCPLRSTVSGDVIAPSSDCRSLVAMVVDMVLVHTVNWDLVAKKVACAMPPGAKLLAINMGPGPSTLRALERFVPESTLRCIDATSDTRGDASPTPVKQEPIAVIGMAAHTPGAADTAQLWELLEKGVNTISKIPVDRFELFPNSLANHESSPCEVKTGNFMNDFADFDHKFFKVSPREARSMDPQQRLLLHTAYEALESAGYVPDATPCFRRDTFGCYVGGATQDYTENLASNIDIHYSTGTLRAFLSGRISYAMQFGGPSVVVDTACSSSIVAIYQACRALMIRDCNAALAGGVNIMTSPNMFAGLERGHFLSPSGQCKTFDASADGYSRGEGCCLFVLKRLSDAIAENDNIMGVIRGIEVRQSGLASSIIHPHGPTQVDLLKTLLEHSGIRPARVSVVEAHGTGTEAGDICELASIRSILSQGRTRDNPLHITSIKANIGHLEAASGAAGLCKMLLMLRHNAIPAQISLQTLHPLITPLEVDNTIIDTVQTQWVVGSPLRVAVLNNFGASGSNGALILEEYIKPNRLLTASPFVFGISAKTSRALKNLRSRYMQWLCDPRNYDIPFDDIAYTATARRQIYSFRLAVSARDKDHLIRALDTSSITHVEPRGSQVIFAFPGHGSQYLDMGASLYATSPVFKSCIDRCQRCLLSLGYCGIISIISGEASKDISRADEFEAYQCAVLAVEFALASLWRHWGVIPSGVIGHSLGEYAAMVTADVLSIETALSIVAKRARFMSQACAIGKTGMVSIGLPFAQVQEILTLHASFSNVTVACLNTESSCVVSGPVEELETLTTHLKDAFGCKATTLQVPLGFHSLAMDPILDNLRNHVATLPIHPPSIPIASNVYGTVVPAGDTSTFQPDYFAKHTRQPVLFSVGLRALEQHLNASEIDAWIEVGPHAICLPMIKKTVLPFRETLYLPSMLKEMPAWDTLMNSLTQLYRTNVPVDWRRVFDERATCLCVELPTYPFDSQKFWVPYSSYAISRVPELTPLGQVPNHPMLSSWSQYPSRQNGNAAIFETPILSLARYIDGHKVGGYALCPASVYLEQALAGAVIMQRHLELDFGRSMPLLRAVEFSRPLVFHREIPLIIHVHVTVHEDGTGSFKVTSKLEYSHKEHIHVHGDLRFSSIRETTSNLALELPAIARRMEAHSREEEAPEIYTTRTTYEVVFPRVVEYAEDYRAIQSLEVNGDGAFGIALISPPGTLDVQSVFLDTLFHVAGFMINMRGDVSDAYICSGVNSLKVLRELVDDKQTYRVYCTNKWISSRESVTADVVVVQECDPPAVVAQVLGAQFRKVRLLSLYRGLAMAADPRMNRNRVRTNSNAIITPSSPRSVIFARSRSNTHNTMFCGTEPSIDEADVGDADELDRSHSGPVSSQTLVSENGDALKEYIRKIMADVLGIADSEEIRDDVDLGSLGLDSLGSIEAQQALRVALNRPIPHNIFFDCPTLSALCEFLADDPNGAAISGVKIGGGEPRVCHHQSSEVALVPLQRCPGSTCPSLYLVHDGSGLVYHYEHILPLQRDVWGICNPRFFTDEPWESLEDMALAYALAIQEHANDAALILGGWSFGGIVAFEIARVLNSHAVEVKGVILIDSPSPSAPALLSDSIIYRLLQDQERTLDAATRALVIRQFKQSTGVLANYRARAQDGEVTFAFLRCTEGFCPPGLDGVPAWFRERNEGAEIVGPWEALVGQPIPVWDIPGHHFAPFSHAHIRETSVQLADACQYAETH